MQVDKPEWLDSATLSGTIDCGMCAEINVAWYEQGKTLVTLDVAGFIHSSDTLHTASVELMRLSLYLKSLEK